MTHIAEYISGFARAFAVTEDRTVLVDAGVSGGQAALERRLVRVGVRPERVSLIVVTHAHPDHIGSLRELKELTGAPVLCGGAAGTAMRAGTGEETVPRTALARFILRFMPAGAAGANMPYPVDITVDREFSLAPYGVAGAALPTPGHTAGSVSVVLDSGDAIIGDLLMSFLPGGPRLPILASDEDAVIRSVKMLLERGVQRFHLAHGGVFGREAVARLVGLYSAQEPDATSD